MFDDFSRNKVDKQCSIIQVFNRNRTSTQRGQEIDFYFCDQVCVLSFEPIVWFLLYDDHHVSRLGTRRLVTFSAELYRLPALHTLVDMNLQ